MAFGKEHVRWQSSLGEFPLGNLYSLFKYERLKVTNNDLFYAFGGADLTISGTVTNIKKAVKGFSFDVRARVTIDDVYAFPSGQRELIPAYKAGVFLQGIGYKRFETTVSFDETYLGFSSCEILPVEYPPGENPLRDLRFRREKEGDQRNLVPEKKDTNPRGRL